MYELHVRHTLTSYHKSAVMDGLTCTREIRDLERVGKLQGKLPIIAVTANVREEQIESAMAAGADLVVQKPFKAADLIASMRDLVFGIAVEEPSLNTLLL
jgi:CheY-like chemotaxis protein